MSEKCFIKLKSECNKKRISSIIIKNVENIKFPLESWQERERKQNLRKFSFGLMDFSISLVILFFRELSLTEKRKEIEVEKKEEQSAGV